MKRLVLYIIIYVAFGVSLSARDLTFRGESLAYALATLRDMQTEYTINFTLDNIDGNSFVMLDLGRVESLAKVEVNGKDFGDLWSRPYRVNVAGVVKPGKNTLKVTVTDTWYNRLVFDAGQPAAKRRTWTIAGPKKGSALHDSGLIGPVKILVLGGK